jgi:ankyrin repeat protein
MSLNSITRRRWLTALLIGVILACALVWGLARYFTPGSVLSRTFDVRFEWNAAEGFKTFELRDGSEGHVGGRVWQFMVGLQIKPALASYLRRGRLDRASGDALVRITRLAPIALPEAWGSDGLAFDTDVTPLMRAAERADLDSVKRLLAEGASVNGKDWLGKTPLLHACVHGSLNPDVVKALLAAGADVNVRDKGGTTPLIAAVTMAQGTGQARIIRELLAAGADVNAKDASGGTALMQASANGNTEAVTLLLAKGAEVGIRTATGVTALSLAEQYNRRQIVELLKRAGPQQ